MSEWVRAPLGPNARRWVTVSPERTVLVVVHTVASGTRLLDMLPIFESDPRVQLVFTTPGVSAVSQGVEEFLAELGGVVIPWSQAVHTTFDLAVTANHSGNLHEISAPLIVISHGIGYTKNSTGNRKPETGNRKPVYGLSAQWLLRDGDVVADAIVLSHPEQLDRLAAEVPEAAPHGVVAGDPCHDRIRVSRPLRDRYRRALGADEHTRIVLVSSTWQRRSLFGTGPDLLRQLLAELPVDEYRVVAALHPNLRLAHGEFQVRTWLADCLRAGLTLLPAREGWRAALLAADAVIGDHGAVTCYAATLDVPILLAAFPAEDVAPGSPVELLGRLAPRLDRHRSLRTQLQRAVDDFAPGRYDGVAALVNSVPGEASRRLRTLGYGLMELPEPGSPPLTYPLPLDGLPGGRPPAAALIVAASVDERGQVTLTRVPADVAWDRSSHHPVLEETHLVVHAEHPDPALPTVADVVFCARAELPEPAGRWLAGVPARFRAARLAAVVESDGCLVAARGAGTFRAVLSASLLGPARDPLVAASALLAAWPSATGAPPPTIHLAVGGARGSCRVTEVQSP